MASQRSQSIHKKYIYLINTGNYVKVKSSNFREGALCQWGGGTTGSDDTHVFELSYFKF